MQLVREKRFAVYLVWVALFIGITACRQPERSASDIAISGIGKDSGALVLMHPTVSNIETFGYLIRQGIVKLPDSAVVIGVYHEHEAYDYSKAEAYLRANPQLRVKLLPVTGALDERNIFGENACSEQFRTIFEHSIGTIFPGGPDIPPSLYGEPTRLLTRITDPVRHRMEVSFMFHLIGGRVDTLFTPFLESRPDYAVLGICLGMQTMNVAAGGTLIQDIPVEVYGLSTVEGVLGQKPDRIHRNYNAAYATDRGIFRGSFHRVRFKTDTSLPLLTEDEPYVLSSHHQCIGRLGRNLLVYARSTDDKVIEAVYHSRYPHVLGVQFHPEQQVLYDGTYIRLHPCASDSLSYRETYPDTSGLEFHYRFWRVFSDWLTYSANR